jgi:predicted dehydrogenase
VAFSTDAETVITRPDVEAVFVCTPDGAHRDIAVAALQAGRHVFCEKPLATSVDDCDTIIEAAAGSGTTLVVGQTLRADGRFAAARRKVASGDLGRPLHCHSRRAWPAAEGRRISHLTTLPLYLSVHDFDALQWICGSPIVRVGGEASGVAIDGITGAASAVATLRFASGLVGVHEVSWGLPDQAGMVLGDCVLTVVGTDGRIAVDASHEGIVLLGGRAGAPAEPSTEFTLTGAVELPELESFEVGVPTGFFATEVAAFEQTVRGLRPPMATAEEGRAAVAAAVAFAQSLERGEPVEVQLREAVGR